MTTTNSKKEYIERWDEHINDFNILAFCKNQKASDEIRTIMKRLHELVDIIAESKEFTED